VHRGIAAGVVGNMLEWYDFTLFGFFAPQIGALFFLAPTACARRQSSMAAAPASRQERAVVDSAGARFAFPLLHQSIWSWALPKTPVNVAEYDWTVQVRNEGRDFTFGFLYFKSPGAVPGRGSFDDLLFIGQTSVALISSNHASLIDSALVEAAPRQDTLWIRVRQPMTLTLLFSGRPQTALLTAIQPGQRPDTIRVPIVYR
jgi:hypothetical protein